ncbi:flagellar hook-associated protein 1 FlgK [Roseovarius sp. MBR-51]
MSLSSALSSALSGLAANTRTLDVVSGNLANALTDGFAPREISLTSTRDSRGVRVEAVSRQIDLGLLSDRRIADAAQAASEVGVAFASAVERVLGTPESAQSLTGRFAALEAALVTASTRPEDLNRLQSVLRQAQALGTHLNDAATEIARLRSAADHNIAETVVALNSGLQQVVALNIQITTGLTRGTDTATLEDQRQSVIDSLAEILPLRQVPRDNGSVALVTTAGGLLLDGRAVTLSFDGAPMVAAHMTLENGLLSGIAIDGTAVPVGSDRGPLQGGRLGALFDIRDRTSVDTTADLDAIARDLVERFQQSGLDPTRASGGAGLFTDAGDLFEAQNESGIATRIAVNQAVDPQRGGDLFRIRDGLAAPSAGPPGDGSLLVTLTRALTDTSLLSSGTLGGGARSAAGHAATLVSGLSQARVAAEQVQSFATGQATEFRTLELANGVDSDAELQRLLLVEQAFGANARMIQTIDDMLDTLLRI